MLFKLITKKELGKIPNIKTESGLKRLFNKKDSYGNSLDYDFFYYKGFLYQAESIGWDYGTVYASIDADLNIETKIKFSNNNRLFCDFEAGQIMSLRNDLTFYTMDKNSKYLKL